MSVSMLTSGMGAAMPVRVVNLSIWTLLIEGPGSVWLRAGALLRTPGYL